MFLCYGYTHHTVGCFSKLSDPGYEGGGGDSSSMFQLGIVLVLWIVVALLLFIFR